MYIQFQIKKTFYHVVITAVCSPLVAIGREAPTGRAISDAFTKNYEGRTKTAVVRVVFSGLRAKP